jgi:ribosomal protein S18 acetylase RimI-like enzyme
LHFRVAEAADIPALATLVNSAYRGESSRRGWTTEADILGGQRTDAGELAELIAAPASWILLGVQAGQIIASIHLKQMDSQAAYVGMLAVEPGLQQRGTGRALLTHAEQTAQQRWQASEISMTVITLRSSLIAYYERLGYQRTGKLQPFPDDPRYGLQKVPGLMLETLTKRF